MQRYLIDTNVLILAIAGKEPDATFLMRAIEAQSVVLSVITIAEFLTKASRVETTALETLVRAFPIFPIDEKVARRAADMRRQERKTSRHNLLDHFMAAQAVLHDCVLVTNNISDFPKKDLRLLTPSSRRT